MSGLSDLDLVAQAMAPTNTPRPDPPTQPESYRQTTDESSARPNGSSHPPATIPHPDHQPDSAPSDPLANLDLSTLTPSDRQALQPLIDALSLSDTDGGDGEDDELRIAELLAQMDAAGEVADDLDGKLDKLLENLGKVEEEIGRDLPMGVGTQRVNTVGTEKNEGDAEKNEKGR